MKLLMISGDPPSLLRPASELRTGERDCFDSIALL